MTDTDIAALVARLRERNFIAWNGFTAVASDALAGAAADALEALQARAEKAEAALAKAVKALKLADEALKLGLFYTDAGDLVKRARDVRHEVFAEIGDKP